VEKFIGGHTKHRLSEYYVKFNEQIDQCIQDSWRINIHESASEMIIADGKKQCRNDFSHSYTLFILME
jgi:hypothetical protein